MDSNEFKDQIIETEVIPTKPSYKDLQRESCIIRVYCCALCRRQPPCTLYNLPLPKGSNKVKVCKSCLSAYKYQQQLAHIGS